MNFKKIRKELEKIKFAPFIDKTDKQLWSIQELSDEYSRRYNGIQPQHLRKYNQYKHRKCKLTPDDVQEIRKKYIPHMYGKKRLAEEYRVSPSVILRIIRGQSWKTAEYSNS